MPLDLGIAVTVVAAGLAARELLKGKEKQDVKPDPAPSSVTTLGKNADALGYERIAEGEALEPGKVQVVTDDAGNIIGEMAETEGGTVVFQKPDGTSRTFTEGEIELHPEPENTTTAEHTVTTNGTASFPAPSTPTRPVTTAVLDSRITALRRSGFTFTL